MWSTHQQFALSLCTGLSPEQVKFKEGLDKAIEEKLEALRFDNGAEWYMFFEETKELRIKLAVVGPPRSGKSTMMYLFGRCKYTMNTAVILQHLSMSS
jgi:hypothetical protein